MAKSVARFTKADLLRAGKTAKELGPDWYVEIAPAPNSTISIVRDPTITPKQDSPTFETTETRQLTRRELYDLVWSAPMDQVAPRLGISDHLLARICGRHRVPTPPRGYWANMAAGKKVKPAFFARTDDPQLETIVFQIERETDQ